MAFPPLAASLSPWVTTVNNLFAQAFTGINPEVVDYFIPRIATADYPEWTTDTIPVVGVGGVIVPSYLKYSSLVKNTDTLSIPAGKVTTVAANAQTVSQIVTSPTGGGITRTLTIQEVVPSDGIEVEFRFSTNYLAKIVTTTATTTTSATFMAASTGPTSATIAKGTLVTITATPQPTPAGNIMYRPNATGVAVSNDTGATLTVSLLVTYVVPNNIGDLPPISVGRVAVDLSGAALAQFTTLVGMVLAADGVVAIQDSASCTTDPILTTSVVSIEGASSIATFADVSEENEVNTAVTAVPIVDGTEMVITTDDGVDHLYTASGVTFSGSTIPKRITPSMTSATTPYGVVTASSDVGYAPWQALAQNLTTGVFWATDVALPQWLQYEAPEPWEVVEYTVVGRNSGSYEQGPKDWELQGSTDNTVWVTLSTVTGQTGWTANQRRTFPVASPAYYSYHRIVISANNGNLYTTINELELNGRQPAYTADTTAITQGEIPAAVAVIQTDIALNVVGDGVHALTPATTELTRQPPHYYPNDLVEADNNIKAAQVTLYSTYYAYKAFDSSTSTYSITSNTVAPVWVWRKFDLPQSVKLISIMIGDVVYHGGDRNPTNFVFQGSNDGVVWEDIQSYTNYSGWVEDTYSDFLLPNSRPWLYIRWLITAKQGNDWYTIIKDIRFQVEGALVLTRTYNALLGLGGTGSTIASVGFPSNYAVLKSLKYDIWEY